ncbi:hypothetical protein NKI31_21925 [Mesorhizobium sp. M0659]|uniref:hypothetical protein n=1 Tax=Mesorhizobium sp. M0659 TaxID=2956980 RepID=UPI003334FA7B
MRRFKDPGTEEVSHSRFCEVFPEEIRTEAHETIRLLMAATSLQDVGVIGKISRWANYPGKFGLCIQRRWFVTFKWSDDFGAYEIGIERRHSSE